MRTATTLLTSPPFRELGYWLYRYRRTWRGSIVISVANPLLFLTAIGIGLGQLVDTGSAYLHGASYLEFVVPGMLTAAVMQTAYLEAAGPVLQSVRSRGSYRAAATTPLDPADIFAGHLMYWTLRAAQNALLFTLIAAAFGAVPPVRVVPLVLAATLVGCAFAAPTAAWAVTVRRSASLNTMFRFVVLPLYMLSGTFFPVEQLPGWLHPVAWLTPLWHGVELSRTLALGTAVPSATLPHLGYLLAMALGGVLVARRTYRRRLHV
ncbi:ABC transporter permease [Micromonospora sp. NPDC049559]|uniref:ABC transporter permease n=1 Tax=Micromonospora sp. NPDC049559 TaxID=3155923 RepID=UPI00344682D4